MYLAASTGLGTMRWSGEDLEKMKIWVDNKNDPSINSYCKYCLLELDNREWGIYKNNKNLHGCNPTIVYDPHNIGNSVIRIMKPDFNFVRNFGGKSKG